MYTEWTLQQVVDSFGHVHIQPGIRPLQHDLVHVILLPQIGHQSRPLGPRRVALCLKLGDEVVLLLLVPEEGEDLGALVFGAHEVLLHHQSVKVLLDDVKGGARVEGGDGATSCESVESLDPKNLMHFNKTLSKAGCTKISKNELLGHVATIPPLG